MMHPPFSLKFRTLLMGVLALATIACNKSDDEPEPTESASTKILLPEVPSATDAVLVCVRSSAEPLLPGLPPSAVDVVKANFGNAPFVDVGPVKLNNIALRKLPDNTYINGDLVIDYKLDPASNPVWSWDGGGTFAPLSFTCSKKIPGLAELEAVPLTLKRSAAQSFSLKELPANASGVIWMVADAKGNQVVKETISKEVTYSAAEMNALSVSRNAVVQAVVYTSEQHGASGKQFFFVLQTMDYQYVDIAD